MQNRWQQQLQAIEAKTQSFRQSTNKYRYSHHNHHRTSAADSVLTPGGVVDGVGGVTGQYSRYTQQQTQRSRHHVSPQNLSRSENIGRIGSRIYGPTVEDAMHEFSKRTTDIMKVMHTVGSELAQVQHVLGTAPVPGAMHTSQTSSSHALLADGNLEAELQHVESIQNCVLQVGNLIDLLIKTLGVEQLQKLSLFGKVSNANKGIGRILDSAKAIKGSLQSSAQTRARLQEVSDRAQRQYDEARKALAQARDELRELHADGGEGKEAQTQLAQVSEDAEQKVQVLTQEVETYQTHLREVNARCRQLEEHLAVIDSNAGQDSERAMRELQSAHTQIARLNQELDECRDAELQSSESKATLQRNLMTEISSILREVARKKIQTADELSARDRTIAQLESAEQAMERQSMKEAEASRQQYESELRLLRDELAAAKHAHELSLVKLEYSTEARGSNAQAVAERKVLELEHRASQLEAQMAQYKTQARTAAELLKEHREADPILELQSTREELAAAKHQGQLELQQAVHRLALVEQQLELAEVGRADLVSETKSLKKELESAREESRAAVAATSSVRSDWAERVARLEQQLRDAQKSVTAASRMERALRDEAGAAADAAEAHRASLVAIASGRHSPSSSRRLARSTLADGIASPNSNAGSPTGGRSPSSHEMRHDWGHDHRQQQQQQKNDTRSSTLKVSTDHHVHSSSVHLTTDRKAFTLADLSTGSPRQNSPRHKANSVVAVEDDHYAGSDGSLSTGPDEGVLLKKQAATIRALRDEQFELQSHAVKLEAELAEAQEDRLLNATTSFVSTRQYRRALEESDAHARATEAAQAECERVRADYEFAEQRVSRLAEAIEAAADGEARLRNEARRDRDLVMEAKRAVDELRNGEDTIAERARRAAWAESEDRVRSYRNEVTALRQELAEAHDDTYATERELHDLQAMADESRAALAISKAALGRVESDLERFSGQAYREEVSRLQLQLKEARAAALRAEDAKNTLEKGNTALREDFSARLKLERSSASDEAVALRNEVAEQGVALLSAESQHRVLLNEMNLARKRTVEALRDTDSLAEDLFPRESGASQSLNSPRIGTSRDLRLVGSGGLSGGTTGGGDVDNGALFMRAIMMLIGRLGELQQQYKLTKEMLAQQTDGLEQMKALVRGESANASSQAMRLQLELASRDQEAFEKAKRLEQQHAAQLRQVEANHRSVQENLAAEIKDLRSRLLEAVRASSSSSDHSDGSIEAKQLASVMDDLTQWRARAQNLESTVVSLRHEAHELTFERDVEKSKAAAEAARLRDELSGRLARMSQDARSEAMKAEVNIKYRDEAVAAQRQLEVLRRRLEEVDAIQQDRVAEANFAAEAKLAKLEAELADAHSALQAARSDSTTSSSLAQEKMAVEQKLLKQQLQNERLESKVASGTRELEAAKIELLQVAARASAEKNDIMRMQEDIYRENMADFEERSAQKDARLRQLADEVADLQAAVDRSNVQLAAARREAVAATSGSKDDVARAEAAEAAAAASLADQQRLQQMQSELRQLQTQAISHERERRELQAQREKVSELEKAAAQLSSELAEEKDQAQRLKVEAALRSANAGHSAADDAERRKALVEMEDMQREAAIARAAAAAAEQRAELLARASASGEEEVAQKLRQKDEAAKEQAAAHASELARLREELQEEAAALREARQAQTAALSTRERISHMSGDQPRRGGISLDDAGKSDEDDSSGDGFDSPSPVRAVSAKTSVSPPRKPDALPPRRGANLFDDVQSADDEDRQKNAADRIVQSLESESLPKALPTTSERSAKIDGPQPFDDDGDEFDDSASDWGEDEVPKSELLKPGVETSESPNPDKPVGDRVSKPLPFNASGADSDSDSDWGNDKDPKSGGNKQSTPSAPSGGCGERKQLRPAPAGVKVSKFGDDESVDSFDTPIQTLKETEEGPTPIDNVSQVRSEGNEAHKPPAVADNQEPKKEGPSAGEAINDFDSGSDDEGGLQLPSVDDIVVADEEPAGVQAPKDSGEGDNGSGASGEDNGLSPTNLPAALEKDIAKESERFMDKKDAAGEDITYKMVREHVAAELGLGPTATKPWKQYFHNVIEAVYDKWDAEDEFTNSADQNLSGGSRASDKKSGKLALSAAPVEDMISDLSDVGSMDMSD